ncbi:complement C1q subcomponent subunit C-like [Hemiscyllium ocellatum]|uniref:complement C1q subcomponent subunit C-like n=1 Tax=Hemiscyllium ocellatum TaxID=170820 RepID=UPI002967093B|nr:complement C1q subcomponent subunit C-like [Hemiscyllium ocellatum]
MFSCGKEVLLIIGVAQCLASSLAHSDNTNSCAGLQVQLQALENRLTMLEDHEHQEDHDHHAALFAASYSAGDSINTIGDHFMFDQVTLNREEGYNSTTGIFTCPIEGVYFFVYSSFPEKGIETSVTLMKNNVEVSSIDSVLPEGSTQFSEGSDLILLAKGDQVWVQLKTGAVLRQGTSLKFYGYRVSD